MKLTPLLLVLLTTVCHAVSIEITADNPENGLIFEQTETLYLHEMNKYLFYKFEIPTVTYIISWATGATKKCENFNYTINFDIDNTFWKRYNPEPNVQN